VEIDLVKARTWLANGAQPTPAVRKLIRIAEANA
jgi:ribosomal protein S16